MNAVPLALKRAIGVGIGLFILFIGFCGWRPDHGVAGAAAIRSTFVFPNSAGASGSSWPAC